jgi:hypothetical protein
MPTRLQRPVTRELPAFVRDQKRMRPLVITLCSDGIVFRAKGTRQRFTIPYLTAYTRAAWIAAEELTQEKKRKRAKRKGV